jgi:hypothetical protein
MRSSSTRQLDLQLEFSDQPDNLPTAPTNDDASASVPLRLPQFGVSNQLYAATARIAGRLNAANVSEKEHNDLLRERQALLDKKLEGQITRKEENRLEYVRWSLDRIDDAKHGDALDILEDRVREYEKFLSDVELLRGQLEQQIEHERVRHQRQQRRR